MYFFFKCCNPAFCVKMNTLTPFTTKSYTLNNIVNEEKGKRETIQYKNRRLQQPLDVTIMLWGIFNNTESYLMSTAEVVVINLLYTVNESKTFAIDTLCPQTQILLEKCYIWLIAGQILAGLSLQDTSTWAIIYRCTGSDFIFLRHKLFYLFQICQLKDWHLFSSNSQDNKNDWQV